MLNCNCTFNISGECLFNEEQNNCEYQMNEDIVKEVIDRVNENERNKDV